MKKFIATIVVAALIGGAATLWFVFHDQQEEKRDTLTKLLRVEQALSETKSNLLGYTKYTDYVTESKKAIEGQTKLLTAKVEREYTQIEHIQRSVLHIPSDATIIVKYTVEYSIGFDLRPESFTMSGSDEGVTITVGKPELVAAPAITKLSHEIPSTSIFIDEKKAVIYLQQQLPNIAKRHALGIQSEEAVIALCEKNLQAFVVDFLKKQPHVRFVPQVKIAYK